MGMFDNIKDQAMNLAQENSDKVSEVAGQAAQQAGDAVDSATGGKFTEQIQGVQAQAGEQVQQMLANQDGAAAPEAEAGAQE